MGTSGNANGSPFQGTATGLAGIAIDALPPDLQKLLKPGKTSDRVQQAISWASRRDPRVLRMHTALDPKIQAFEDIARAEQKNMDAIAKRIAGTYQRRALATGAITGLPGGLWAIVAAGADVQLTAIYAVRMASQVAQAYGYDTSLLEEQAHLADVLALAAGVDSLRGIGNWLTREGLIHLLPEVLPKLLIRVSVELTEEQAAKFVGRLIPGVGAAVGGAIDFAFLRAASNRAIGYYRTRYMEDHGLILPTSPVTHALPPGAPIPPMPGQTPRVIEGSVVHPQVGSAAAPSALPGPGYVPVKVTTRTLAPSPAPTKRHRSAPERFGVYLAIFAVLALGITIAACAALAVLIEHGLGSLGR